MGRATTASAEDKPSAEQPAIPHVDAPPQQQQPWSQSEADEDADVKVVMPLLCSPAKPGTECLAGTSEVFIKFAEVDAFTDCSAYEPW